MYPFVPRSAVIKIFGGDLFEREATIPILRELAGLEVKPFECVATTAEIIAALALAIAKANASGEPLPLVLEYASQNIRGVADPGDAEIILSAYGPHRIPQELETVLTKALKKSPRSR
jgi:hypothetical protein